MYTEGNLKGYNIMYTEGNLKGYNIIIDNKLIYKNRKRIYIVDENKDVVCNILNDFYKDELQYYQNCIDFHEVGSKLNVNFDNFIPL